MARRFRASAHLTTADYDALIAQTPLVAGWPTKANPATQAPLLDNDDGGDTKGSAK